MSTLTSAQLEEVLTELHGLVRTGTPLPEGLRRFADRLKPGARHTLCADIAAGLEAGKSLEDAVTASSVGVPPQFVAVLRCMAISGQGNSVLGFALHHARRLRAHREALTTAAWYPALVIVTCLTVLWLFSNRILPRFVDIYSQLGAELPSMTMMVLNVGAIFRGPVGTAVFLIVLALVFCYFGISVMRERLLNGLSHLPGFRTLVSIGDTAMSMQFLGLMLSSGVPLPVALDAAGFAVNFSAMRDALHRMSTAAAQGNPTAPHLSPWMPATAAWLYRNAEEAGDLPEACIGISEYCENTFERLAVRRAALFEPALILIVAVFIGVLIISCYLPLFSIPKVIR